LFFLGPLIAYRSSFGIVASKPGAYRMTIHLVANGGGATGQIRHRVIVR
jgi:hypothetical protein